MITKAELENWDENQQGKKSMSVALIEIESLLESKEAK